MPDEEVSVLDASTTKESKKRKVVFAASSTEGTEPRGVSEVPRRKKKKSDGDNVMDSAVAEPGSSHGITKKKKSKKDTSPRYDSSEHIGAMGVSIAHGDRETPVEGHQLAGSELASPGDAQSEPTSSSSSHMRTSKVKLSSGPDQTSEDKSQKEAVHTSMYVGDS